MLRHVIAILVAIDPKVLVCGNQVTGCISFLASDAKVVVCGTGSLVVDGHSPWTTIGPVMHHDPRAPLHTK
jgi:hypothetical protein